MAEAHLGPVLLGDSCEPFGLDVTAFCGCGHLVMVHNRRGECEVCRWLDEMRAQDGRPRTFPTGASFENPAVPLMEHWIRIDSWRQAVPSTTDIPTVAKWACSCGERETDPAGAPSKLEAQARADLHLPEGAG